MKGEKSIHYMLRLYYELYKTLLFTYLLDLVIIAYNREPRDSYFFDLEIYKTDCIGKFYRFTNAFVSKVLQVIPIVCMPLSETHVWM